MKLAILGLAILLLAPLASSCFAGPAEVSRFMAEYPKAAEALKTNFAQAKGKFRTTRVSPGKPEQASHGTFAIDHGFAKISMTKKGRGGEENEVTICSAANRSFGLGRRAGQEAYFILGIGESPGDRQEQVFSNSFGIFYSAPCNVFQRPLLEIMNSATFRLLSAEPIDWAGRSCIEIAYEITYAKAGKVSVVLDPGFGWSIRHAEIPILNEEPQVIDVTVDYSADSNQMPVPLLVSIKDPISTASCKFEEFSFAPTPEGEFTLSYYGLPEFNNPPRGYRAIWWLFAIAIAGLILALALRRYGRRSSRPSA